MFRCAGSHHLVQTTSEYILQFQDFGPILTFTFANSSVENTDLKEKLKMAHEAYQQFS
jgi:hypothetical protein